MTYEVRLHPAAVKALSSLPPADRRRVKAALKKLADDPTTKRSGVDIKRLKGTRGREDLFRLRIGKYRAIYAVEDHTVLVTDLFERGRGYEV